MYYMKNGIQKGGAGLGYVFAIFGALAFGIGNMTQINSITTQVKNVAQVYTPQSYHRNIGDYITRITSIIIAIFVAFVIGGIKRG